MCTVSWQATANGYELFFNRDESRLRQPALPPTVRTIDGCQVLAPTDGNAGGTWISVNAHGLCLALLNRYQDSAAGPGPFTSRGQLVLDLASSTDLVTVEGRLATLEMNNYRPFTLLVVALDRSATVQAHQVYWNGRQRGQPEAVQAPLASSGHVPETIQGQREALFRELRVQGMSLQDFHRSHLPDKGPLSPCMHRPDARSVSLMRVAVDGGLVSMEYADGPPCRTQLGRPVGIGLRRESLRPPGA